MQMTTQFPCCPPTTLFSCCTRHAMSMNITFRPSRPPVANVLYAHVALLYLCSLLYPCYPPETSVVIPHSHYTLPLPFLQYTPLVLPSSTVNLLNPLGPCYILQHLSPLLEPCNIVISHTPVALLYSTPLSPCYPVILSHTAAAVLHL
jgi:hypothetical protein